MIKHVGRDPNMMGETVKDGLGITCFFYIRGFLHMGLAKKGLSNH